jgi:hypothetical protein
MVDDSRRAHKAIFPEAVAQEHARLVARGVRAMALVGECEASETEILRIHTILEACACDTVLAFVVDRGDGIADAGYAAAPWVIDLYRWLITDNAVPEVHQHRIIGLLLGYSPTSIKENEEWMRYRPARLSSASA